MYFPLSLTLIAISSQTLRREAIHRLTADRSHWYSQYDYIVVGAGSAGCVVANRLSADHKHSVLLLEAGGPQSAIWNDLPEIYPLYLLPYIPKPNVWNYYLVPQKNAGLAYPVGIYEPRGKVLGGSSAVNGMQYLRGNRRGFDDWVDTYGAKGWSYAEVLPLFIKSENNSDQSIVRMNPGFHGTDGPIGVWTVPPTHKALLQIQKTYNELGFKNVDTNGAEQLGLGPVQLTIKDLKRSSTASAYIDPNPHPNSLHILTKALVTKILFRKSMNKLIAFGVEFIKDNQLYRVVANKEIILSAGSINSPQILMLSGIGPKDHLKSIGIEVKADLPVGNNLANHPALSIVSVDLNKKNNSSDKHIPEWSEYPNQTQNPNKQFFQLASTALYTNTKNNAVKDWPNIQILNIFVETIGLKVLELAVLLVKPKSRGTVRLQSANPYASPLIDPQFLTHPQDMDDFLEAIRFVYFVLKNTSFANYIANSGDFKPLTFGCPKCTDRPLYLCDQLIRCQIKMFTKSSYHPCGTCRMGSVHRSDVVVSERLRVKNVLNLRVCDSSVFPDIPNVNINAPTIMVGEKCAQMIKEDQSM